MRLKKGFLVHQVGEEHMAVAAGEASHFFNGLIRNNETADFIFRMLLNETDREQIVNAMAGEYDAPREEIAADVDELLEQLRQAGFLDE